MQLRYKYICLNDHELTKDILCSKLYSDPSSVPNVDALVEIYNTVLRELMIKHAPEKTHSVVHRTTILWMNEEILTAKRQRRYQERLWRKSGLTLHKMNHKQACDNVKDLIKKAKSDYYVKTISDCHGDQKKLFHLVNSLLGKCKPSGLPEFSEPKDLAEVFNDFFITKISNIRGSLETLKSSVNFDFNSLQSVLKSSTGRLTVFDSATTKEISSIIKKSSKASCNLDPIPSSLLCDVLPSLAPVITDIVNTALKSGCFPSDMKSAIVKPLLKKPGLDTEVLKNYRPVSNLSFVSKVIEKVVASRLIDHMKENSLLDQMQSAYRSGHSTETALLRVYNDIVMSVDKGHGVYLILLDLSAAFDTVDHPILLSFLHDHVGLDGCALDMFRSYLDGRTQCVSINGVLSELCKLTFGVPQGSVLGPIIFCIYTIPLGAILRKHDVSYHIYADDTQLYCSFNTKSPTDALDSITACVSEIRAWMIINNLKINDDKTEFLQITSPFLRNNLPLNAKLQIGQHTIPTSASCKSLGVMFDCHLNMITQINSISRSCYFHLRNINAIRQLIPDYAAAQLVHSLVTSRLDYCNSLLYGLPACKIKPLQRVQNVAARIVSRCDKRSHITPVLYSLHWLPVEQRIKFKILLITFKCIHSLAPEYLSELIHQQSPNRSRRSQYQNSLMLPRTRLKSSGDRAFTFAAPKEWNKLPLHLKTSPNIASFKTNLKTFLFNQYFNTL